MKNMKQLNKLKMYELNNIIIYKVYKSKLLL